MPDTATKLDLLSALTDFYLEYAPRYAGKAGKILRKYKGREDFIWRSLFSKYGAIPDFDLGLVDPAFVRGNPAWLQAQQQKEEAVDDDEDGEDRDDSDGGREAKLAAEAKVGRKVTATTDAGTITGTGNNLKQQRRRGRQHQQHHHGQPTAIDTARAKGRLPRQTTGRAGSGTNSPGGSRGSSISPTVRNAARRSALRTASQSPSRGSNSSTAASTRRHDAVKHGRIRSSSSASSASSATTPSSETDSNDGRR